MTDLLVQTALMSAATRIFKALSNTPHPGSTSSTGGAITFINDHLISRLAIEQTTAGCYRQCPGLTLGIEAIQKYWCGRVVCLLRRSTLILCPECCVSVPWWYHGVSSDAGDLPTPANVPLYLKVTFKTRVEAQIAAGTMQNVRHLQHLCDQRRSPSPWPQSPGTANL